jgi:SAM-dependent methyltransferase
MTQVFRQIDVASMRMLHFAPEPFFSPFFRDAFGRYETADIAMPGVDHMVDLQALPFDAGSYDIVYASHVLEHVPNDEQAIAEIRRILAPGGLAVLPVPIVNPVTAEYPAPNAFESMHVRAPGPDYFRRFAPHFSRIDTYTSTQFPEVSQTYLNVDRTMYPTAFSPLRQPMPGTRHADFVPVCWV